MMNKHNYIHYFILFFSALIIVGISSFLAYNSIEFADISKGVHTFEKDGYSITVTLNDDETAWNYSIKGDLPTHCHNAEANVDTYLDTLRVVLQVTEPPSGSMCAQALKELALDGSITARGEDRFVFDVVNEAVSTIDNDSKEPVSLTTEGFDFTSKYIGDNEWSYTIFGNLPNQCYTFDVSEIVAESYPEQVKISLSITPPNEGVICAQALQTIEYKGTYSASSESTVNFDVIYP